MTEINEESRYDAGESRQLRRNDRDVLIVLDRGEETMNKKQEAFIYNLIEKEWAQL